MNREHPTDSENDSTEEAVKVNPIKEVYTYDENRKNIFKENIRKDKNLEILNKILDKTELSQEEVVSNVSRLNNVLLSAAKKSFFPKKTLKNPKVGRPRNIKTKNGLTKSVPNIAKSYGNTAEIYLPVHLIETPFISFKGLG